MTPIPFLPASYAPDWDNELAARPATVGELVQAAYGEGLPEARVIGDDVVFGSAEWFEKIPEVKF